MSRKSVSGDLRPVAPRALPQSTGMCRQNRGSMVPVDERGDRILVVWSPPTRDGVVGSPRRSRGVTRRPLIRPLSRAHPGSSVRISRAPPGYPPGAFPPTRAGRSVDHESANQTGSDGIADPAEQGRREQPELGRPGGRLRDQDELSGVEVLRPAVLGHVPPDQVGPPARDAADGEVGVPASIGHDPVDQPADRLRIPLARARPGKLRGPLAPLSSSAAGRCRPPRGGGPTATSGRTGATQCVVDRVAIQSTV
jgi:hypothetical protein